MELKCSAALDLRVEEQLELVDRLGPKWTEFSKSWRHYTPANHWYNLSDGAVYYSVLTTLRPKRVIEVRSGFLPPSSSTCAIKNFMTWNLLSSTLMPGPN